MAEVSAKGSWLKIKFLEEGNLKKVLGKVSGEGVRKKIKFLDKVPG